MSKIKNIVTGQLDHFREIYFPIFRSEAFLDILKVEDDGLLLTTRNDATTYKLITRVPRGVTKNVGPNKEFDKLYWRLNQVEKVEVLKDLISQTNAANSKSMLLYHLLTISPLKNIKYAVKKLSKSLFK